MRLIDSLRPDDRLALRRLRKRLANRMHMRRVREARKLLCVGVDLPIEAGTCGRMVHAEAERCRECARRRHWLLNHALSPAELGITAILGLLEDDRDARRELPSDTGGDVVPDAVPLLDNLSDLVA